MQTGVVVESRSGAVVIVFFGRRIKVLIQSSMMTEVVNVEAAPNNNAAANKPSENKPLSWLRINLDYFRTPPGLVKIAEAVSRIFENAKF